MTSKNPNMLESGSLYIVSTPIGNLKDITLRALDTLKEVNIIAAESTDHTRGLCSHYGIRTKLISYNQHNHKSRAPGLISRLKNGESIALVTCAGTPALSDPGALLITMACDNDIKITPIPGASAALAGIAACGLKIDRFLFAGFLSNKAGKRKNELKELADENKAIIFYEAPRRVISFLEQLYEIFGNRKIAVLRELTKAHEEILRGNVEDIITELSSREIRGEFTIITEGSDKTGDKNAIPDDIEQEIKSMIDSNKGTKDIASSISEIHNLKYRAVYKKVLDIKRELEKE